MARAKKSAVAAAPKDETLELVLKHFNQSWDYASSSWHPRWEDNYKLYNNERIKRGYLGISDTFVPMTFSTVETLTSAVFATKPKIQYLPPQNRLDQDTTILNALNDYWWDKDQWSVKVVNTGRGFFREGTAVDYFTWSIDHPIMINVPIRDFFINPYANELDERTTGWCGRRYITTLDELKSFEIVDLSDVDENGDPTGKMIPKYKHLDKIATGDAEAPVKGSGSTSSEQKTDKEEKDMLYGSTLPADKNQVEVIEYWTVDKTISVANRMAVIEDTENYFKAKDRANGSEFPQGILPFADARNYVDGSLFYAKGDVDFIADQQEDLNDFSNQEKDAVSFNLNQQKTLDPKFKHLMKEIENIPGEIIPVPAEAYKPVPTGVIPPEAFNERMNIKNEIRETTASNEVIKGVGQTAGAKQTATEINAQIQGAGQRIGLKVTQLENGYFHRMAKIVFKLTQLYVTEPMMVRIMGKEGANWEEFDPKEFDGLYEPRVQLDITVQQKKQAQQNDSANLLKAFLNDPNVDQRALTKLVLQRSFDLDPDEVDDLMVKDPNDSANAMGGAIDPATGQPMPAAPGAMPGMVQPGAPMAPTGPPPKLPSESITFKDAVAAGATDAAAAMLEQAGLPGDDMRKQAVQPGQVVAGQIQDPTLEPADPNTGLPMSAAAQLPPDLTPEELQQLQQIHTESQQGAPTA